MEKSLNISCITRDIIIKHDTHYFNKEIFLIMIDISTIPIIRERRRTYGLKITNDGQVVIKAPLKIAERILREFAAKHTDWIEKQLAAREKFVTNKFTAGEIENLFRQSAADIPQRVAIWAEKLAVTYSKIAIRNMVHNYGSCTTKGKLTFNCLLMLCPSEVIDCIVVHELCHRLQMNHSKKFYREILRVMPDYYSRRDWLRKHGDYYLHKLKASNLSQKQIVVWQK